jgi:RNA polymerase sigma factor (sigma-70 family)
MTTHQHHAIDNSRLWNRFREGDPSAFSQIYEAHVQALFQYGIKLTADDGFVKDCIHDLFVELHQRRATIGDADNIRAYLFQSLKRKIFRGIKNKLPTSDTLHQEPFYLEAAIDEQLSEQETTRQTRRLLREAINRLPFRQKEIVYLRYINNFSLDEITQIMGINYQAVCNTLHKAIKELRKSITIQADRIK